MLRTIFSSLILGAALVSAAPAFAQTGDRDAKADVHFRDLDLNNPADAAKLYRRIEATADYVCGGQPASVMERDANREYAACMRTTIATAVHDLHAPLVTSVLEGASVKLASR